MVALQLFKREIVRLKYKYIADARKAPVIAFALEGAIMGWLCLCWSFG